MGCYCACDDYDAPRVFVETWRTARKPHRCCECRDTIEPGARYQHVSGNWDGKWSTFKTCESCREVRHIVFERTGCAPAYGEAGCCYAELLRDEAA